MKYSFEDYKGQSSRLNCPHCGGKNTFVPYIDNETGQRMDEKYGKCNKDHKCGYHLSPYNDDDLKQKIPKYIQPKKEPLNFLSWDFVKKSMNPDNWNNNNFILYLIELFGKEKAQKLVLKFYIGTTKEGGTVFWHIDYLNNVRQGQVIHYNKDGHRNKEKSQASVPSMLKVKGNYKQCIFNERALKIVGAKKIGIVESPKTAIICEGFKYQNIDTWISQINLTGLTQNKIYPIKELLKYKEIYLFNDYHYQARMINGIEPMKKKGGIMTREGEEDKNYTNKKELLNTITSNTSNIYLIDSPNGAEDESGNDIADYLTKYSTPPQEKKPEPEEEDLLKDSIFIKCDQCREEVINYLIHSENGINTCVDCLEQENSITRNPLFKKLCKNLGLEIEKIEYIPVSEDLQKSLTVERVLKGKDKIHLDKVYKHFAKQYDWKPTFKNIEKEIKHFCEKNNFSYIYENEIFYLIPF